MGNVVDVKVLVKTDGTLDKANKGAKELNNTFKEANKNASTIKVPSVAAPKGAVATGKSVTTSSAINNSVMGESKSARSIGAGAGTGSAASDFAAQSKGLGGLVHVYATFAANLFAVSAAFSALSKAMDVTNLVSGLDQIGAASGKNLGSMAKQMVKVADGAISLQQAMTSTAMASSGGMNNDQMLRMTKVAQQASLALGRDLPDSMERLTKGIIKTQPELLDELGIMTRVIPAQQAYAEKIGKTTSSLTTFEKQQAFTNAVLEEGERKFSSIALSSNVYSKVLASIQNLMQSVFESVNKVLGPVVELLSKSPTALLGVLALIGTTLLKQAIPALGMMKENAKLAAEESKNLAIIKSVEAAKGYKAESLRAKQAAVDNAKIELDKAVEVEKIAKDSAAKAVDIAKQGSVLAKARAREEFNLAKQNADNLADIKMEALVRAEKKMKDLVKRDASSNSAAIKTLNTFDIDDIKPKDLSKIEASAKALESKAIKANIEGNEKLYQSYKKSASVQREYVSAILEAKQAHLDYDRTTTAADAVRITAAAAANKSVILAKEQEILATTRAAKLVSDTENMKLQAQTKVEEASKAFDNDRLKREGIFNTGYQTRILAERALLKATTDNIVAQGAQTASTKGFFAAWKEGRDAIAKARSGPSEEILKIPVLDSQGKVLLDEFGKAVENTEKIVTPKMGAIRGGWTSLKLGIGAATTAIGTFMNFTGPWLQAIGLAVAAFGAFASWATNSAKESAAFAESSDNVTASLSNVSKTLEHINKKSMGDFLSIESLQAKSNALNDLSASVTKMVDNYTKLTATQNTFDKISEGIMSGLFGKGSVDSLRKNLADSIASALKAVESGPAKEQAIKTLKGLLGEKVDVTNLKAVDEALFNLNQTSVTTALRTIPSVLQELSREAGNSSSALTAFAQTLADISKQSTIITNTLIPTDNFSKMGMEAAKAAKSMGEAFKNGPIDSLLALEKLSGNMQALSLLPKNTAAQLGTANKEIKRLTESIGTLQKSKQEASNNIETSTNTISENKGFGWGYSARLEKTRNAKIDLKAAQDIYDITSARLDKEQEAAEKIRKDYESLPEQFAQSSFKLLAKGLATAMNDAAINSAKGFLNIMQQGGSNVESELIGLEKKQIDVQIAQIKSNFSIVESQAILAATIEKNTLFLEQANLLEKLKNSRSISEATDISKNIDANQKAIDTNTSKFKIINDGGKSARADATKGIASQETLTAMKEMETYMTSLFGMWGQIAGKQSEKYVANLRQMVADKNAAVIADEKSLNIRSRDLANEKALLETQKGSSIYVSEALAASLAKNAADSIDVKLAQDNLSIRKQQNYNAVALEESSKRVYDASGNINDKELEHYTIIQETIEDLEKQTKSMEKAAEIAKAQLSITILQANEQARIKYEAGIQSSIGTDIFSTSNEILGNKEKELKYLQDIGVINAQSYTERQAVLALEQQSLSYANEKRLAQEKFNADMFESDAALKNIRSSGGDDTTQLKIQQDIVDAYNRQLTLMGLKNTNVVKTITLEAEHKAMVESQAESMAKMVSVTESLTSAFGEVGTAIGKVGEAILNMAQDEEKYAERKLALQKETAAARDDAKTNPDGYKKALENEAKLESKNTSTKLGNIAKTAGATKKLFAEHTLAYKLLDGAEKASHALKMFNTLKELSTDIASMGASLAAFLGITASKDAAAVPGTLMAFVKDLGWPGVAIGAAFIASLGLSSGGGSMANPAGMTAKDMQQTQGTGQSWKDGAIVDNGGGVFGDVTAKSNSIQNSLDILTATSIEGLSFSNKQTELLSKIANGIKEVAKNAYGVQGIRTGSGFGTVEGSSSNPGLLGLFASSSSTEIINAGIKLVGTFESLGEAGNGLIQQFETVQSSSSNSGIFGLFGSESSSIDTSVKDLEPKAAKAIRETFSYMGNLLVEQGKYLGLTAQAVMTRANSLNIEVMASLKGLKGTETQEELNAIFSGILDDAFMKVAPSLAKYKDFGEGFAQTVTRVLDGFDKVNLGLTSMGLEIIKFTEIPDKATTAMYDAQEAALKKLNDAKSKVPEAKYDFIREGGGSDSDGISTYQQINKDEIATANKLIVDTTKVYTEATDAINLANAQMTTRGYALTEALIEAAGGLDKFIESAKLYSEMFLTESERVLIKQTTVKDRLAEIGKADDTAGPMQEGVQNIKNIASELFKTVSDGNDSIINTKKEYKSLIDKALEGAKQVVAEEDTIGLARRKVYVDLYAQLTDPALLQSQKDIWEYFENAKNAADSLWSTISGTRGLNAENLTAKNAIDTAYSALLDVKPMLTMQEIINMSEEVFRSLTTEQQNYISTIISSTKQLKVASDGMWSSILNSRNQKGDNFKVKKDVDSAYSSIKEVAPSVTLNQILNITEEVFSTLTTQQQEYITTIITGTKQLNSVLDGFTSQTAQLSIDLLTAQGNTAGAANALKELETKGLNPVELAAYNYNKSLRDQITNLNSAKAAIVSFNSAASSIRSSQYTISNTPAVESAETELSISLNNLNAELKKKPDYTEKIDAIPAKTFFEQFPKALEYLTEFRDKNLIAFNDYAETNKLSKDDLTTSGWANELYKLVTTNGNAAIRQMAIDQQWIKPDVDGIVVAAVAATTKVVSGGIDSTIKSLTLSEATDIGKAIALASTTGDTSFTDKYSTEQIDAFTRLMNSAATLSSAQLAIKKEIQGVTDSLTKEGKTLKISLLEAQGNFVEANKEIKNLATEGMQDFQIAIWETNEATKSTIASLETAASLLKKYEAPMSLNSAKSALPSDLATSLSTSNDPRTVISDYVKGLKAMGVAGEAGLKSLGNLTEEMDFFVSASDNAKATLKDITEQTTTTIATNGLRDYEKELYNIDTQMESWRESLRLTGNLTKEASDAIDAYGVSQKNNIIKNVNTKAVEVMSGINTELENLGKSDLEITLSDINKKGIDFKASIEDLGNTTEDTTKNINKLTTALTNSAANKVLGSFKPAETAKEASATLSKSGFNVGNLDSAGIDKYFSDYLTSSGMQDLDGNWTAAGIAAVTAVDKVSNSINTLKTASDTNIAAQEDWQNQLDVLTGKSTQKQIDRQKQLSSTTDETTLSLMNQVFAQQDLNDSKQIKQDYDRALLEAADNTVGLEAFDKAITDAALITSGWTQVMIDAVDAQRLKTKTDKATKAFNRALLEASENSKGLRAFDNAVTDAARLSEGWTQAQVNVVRTLEDVANAFDTLVEDITKASKERVDALTLQRDAASADISNIQQLFQRSGEAAAEDIRKREELKVDSLQKEIDSINSVSETTSTLVSDLKSMADALDSAIKTLRDIPELAEQSYASAMYTFDKLISEAKQGKNPDQKVLSDTLDIVSSKDSNSYASYTDMKRDRLIAANKAEYLNSLLGTQLTSEEKSLENQKTTIKSLEEQIKVAHEAADTDLKALEAQIKIGEDTLSSINGVDTSIVTMDAALAQVAVLDGKYQKNHVGLLEEQIKFEEKWLEDEIGRLDDLKKNTLGTISAVYNSANTISNASYISAGMISSSTYHGSALVSNAVYASATSISAAISNALNPSETSTTNTTSSITGYAEGGTHAGGLRLVGENGPELEVTGPSTILNSNSTAGLLDKLSNNADLIAEIRLLRDEVRALKESAKVTAEQTKITAKQLTRWEADGLPATTI